MTDTRRTAYRAAQGPRGERLQDRILAAFVAAGNEGRTDGELSTELGAVGDSIRPKRQILEQAGVIVATERRRPSKHGQPMIVRVVKTAYEQQLAKPEDKAVRCRRCGSTRYVDVPIHGGRSIRRDCARCDAFIDFPERYTLTPVEPEKQEEE